LAWTLSTGIAILGSQESSKRGIVSCAAES